LRCRPARSALSPSRRCVAAWAPRCDCLSRSRRLGRELRLEPEGSACGVGAVETIAAIAGWPARCRGLRNDAGHGVRSDRAVGPRPARAYAPPAGRAVHFDTCRRSCLLLLAPPAGSARRSGLDVRLAAPVTLPSSFLLVVARPPGSAHVLRVDLRLPSRHRAMSIDCLLFAPPPGSAPRSPASRPSCLALTLPTSIVCCCSRRRLDLRRVLQSTSSSARGAPSPDRRHRHIVCLIMFSAPCSVGFDRVSCRLAAAAGPSVSHRPGKRKLQRLRNRSTILLRSPRSTRSAVDQSRFRNRPTLGRALRPTNDDTPAGHPPVRVSRSDPPDGEGSLRHVADVHVLLVVGAGPGSARRSGLDVRLARGDLAHRHVLLVVGAAAWICATFFASTFDLPSPLTEPMSIDCLLFAPPAGSARVLQLHVRAALALTLPRPSSACCSRAAWICAAFFRSPSSSARGRAIARTAAIATIVCLIMFSALEPVWVSVGFAVSDRSRGRPACSVLVDESRFAAIRFKLSETAGSDSPTNRYSVARRTQSMRFAAFDPLVRGPRQSRRRSTDWRCGEG